ncbi:hypothetical protein P6U16_08360 [Rhizobium sp. 32-5/1]|uniref:hypothetical protein n=1 Tax=Rhizobium sp. 32-5/1 TaxID=3019602 RepID=UPI00240E1CF4|nr:hypothetical protein [Rhizobium sp. 32-5/1]WEZ84572.1 hypothetical protein P6U16_08360 [Rhizobium sp. 32-5/1]
MAIFTAIATAISGALFAGAALATSLISSALAFGAQLAISYLNRPKKQKYTAVQGEVQFGANVPAGAMFGTGKVVGHRLFYAKWGSGNKVNADVFLLSNGWCDGLEPYVYFYGEKHELVARTIIGNEHAHYGITGFGDAVSIRFYDGRPGQGVDAKLVSDTASLGQNWKSTSVCAGHAYVVVERTYSADLFPKGRPDFEWVLRGLRLYDPRKDSTVAGGSGSQRLATPSTWVFSKSPALQRLNYQLGIRGLISGRTIIGEGKSIGQIDLSTYFVAMNVCDTVREGKKTYESAIYVDSGMDHTEVLKEFDDAMAGYGLNRRGLSGIIPGAPQVPVLDITASDIPVDRAQQVQRRKSAFDLYNYISGQFTSIESNWAEESLTPVYVNADVAADGRPRQTANDFLQVTDPDIAQYLLNIRYRQNRRGGTATVPVSRRVGLAVSEGEWVTFQGVTWLITEWQADEQFRFTLVLAETNADIYDDGDIDPGPIVIPPAPTINPSLLSTVAGFNVEAGLVQGASGSQVPCLRFTWTPPQDPTITAVRFFYTAAGDVTVYEDQSVDPEKGFYVTTKNVASGKAYTARATITTVPDRFKTFTAWITTLTSTGNLSVLDGSITVTKIADAAITASKIANEAVTSLKLADQAVTTAKLQVAAVTADIIANSAVISAKIADAAVTGAKMAAAAIDATKFAAGIQPVGIIAGAIVPTTKTTDVVLVNGKIYRWNGTAYTAGVPTTDFVGTVSTAQIADDAITNAKLADLAVQVGNIADSAITAAKIADAAVTTTKFASGIEPVGIIAGAVVPVTKTTEVVTVNGKLYRWNGSAYVASVPTVDLTGTILTAQIADDAITNAKLADLAVQAANIADSAITSAKIVDAAVSTAKFASGIEPVGVIAGAVVPVTKTTEVVTVNGKLYRWSGSAYVASIPTVDLTGTILTAQIADNAITSAKVAALAIDAAALASNAVTQTKIADNSISTAKLQANSVVANNIASNVISARQLILADFENFIPDGQFEQAIPADIWNGSHTVYNDAGAGSAPKIWTYTGSTQTGGKALVLDNGVSGGTAIQLWIETKDFIPVTEDDHLSWGIGIKTNDGSSATGLYYRIWWYDKDKVALASPVYNDVLSNQPIPSAWTKRSGKVAIPTGAKYCKVRIYHSPATTRYLIIDRVYLRKSEGAELIVDGTIVAAHIAANTITAALIAANTITANEIAANAITTSELAAGSVTAAKIVAGTITATEIAAGAISTAKLAAGAVTANELAANSVVAGKIAANAIVASNIAAKTITADKLVMADFTNYVENPTFADGDVSWVKGANATIVTGAPSLAFIGDNYMSLSTGTTATTRNANVFPVVPGTTFMGSVTARAISSPDGNLNFRIRFMEADGSTYVGQVNIATFTPSDTSYTTKASGTLVVPAGAVYAWVDVQTLTALTTGSYRIGAVRVQRKNAGELIVDGTIVAAHIAANTITAAEIAANAITTSELASDSVTAAKIVAGTITAAEIASGAITTVKLAASAVTANELAANSVVAGKVAADAIVASNIAANAITAKQLVLVDFENFIPDGAFDQSIPTDIWDGNYVIRNAGPAAGTDPQVWMWTGDAQTGGRAIVLDNGIIGGTNLQMWIRTKDFIPVTTGDSLAWDISVRTTDAGGTSGLYYRLTWYDRTKTALASPVFTDVVSNNTIPLTWTKRSGIATVPAGATYCKVSIYHNNNSGTRFLVVDRVSLRKAEGAELIVDGTLTAAKIVANSITAAQIASNTITATQIAALAITSSELAANSVVAGKIAAGAISATEIAAGAITTGLLAASAITSDKIAADAVITSKIAANAITATEIATSAVTATKIAAGAIIAGKIAAGTIVAADIAASTITGAKIAADTIGANNIAANAITARELTLTDFSNVYPDYDFVATDGFYTGSAVTFSGTSNVNRGKNAMALPVSASEQNTYSQWITVESGDYYAEISVNMATTAVGAGRVIAYINYGTIDAAGVVTSDATFTTIADKTDTSSSTRVGVNFTVSGSQRAIRVRFRRIAGGSQIAYFGGVFIRKRYGGNLIVDGGITADKIAANSITADKMNVTSLSAISATLGSVNISNAIIGTLTVGTSNIAANAVTASAAMSATALGDPADTVALTSLMAGSPALISITGSYSISAGSGASGNFNVSVVNTTTGSTAYSFSISYSSGNTAGGIDAFRIHSTTNAGTNNYKLVIERTGTATSSSVSIDVKILYWRR